MAGMMSTNTPLKGVLDFSGVFDIVFLFIFEISNYVQKGSEYTLSAMSCETFALSLHSSDFVDLCTNI